MLTLEKQSTLAPLSKSIYLLLTLFASPLSIRITGVDRIKFDSGAYFCLNDFRSLTALNVSRAAASNVLIVPTWRTNLSTFFLKKSSYRQLHHGISEFLLTVVRIFCSANISTLF